MKARQKALEELARAAGVLSRAMLDSELLSYLHVEGPLHFEETIDGETVVTTIPDAGRFQALLARIEHRASVQAKALPVRKGQATVGPRPDSLSAREACALMISQASQLLCGKPGGAGTARLLEAADMLWLASGGSPIGRDGTDRSKWRKQFERIARATEIERLIVCRHFDRKLARLVKVGEKNV